MITTPDGVALYTEEDVQALRVELTHKATKNYEDGKGFMHRALRREVIDFFKSEISSGSMIKEDAESIFNSLASAVGWAGEDSLATKWTVSVSYANTTIGEFTVEADDEDSAIDELRDNLEIEDVEVNFSLSYNGDSCRETVNTTWEFDSSDLEFEAEEQ